MEQKRKIYFRADAGPNIGYGHFIRSLALADMLKQDFDCTMFTQTPTDYQILEAEPVCPIVALPNDDSKFFKFLEYLHGDEIVVLDNYFFTTDYQRAIKAKGCQLVCIDDMHDKHYVADAVISHGANTKDQYDVEDYTKLYLGREYSLLRKPFLTHEKGEHKKGVFVICFGGSDPYNLTQKFVDILSSNQDLVKIYAIVGDGYQYMDELRKNKHVEILHSLTAQQVVDLFSSAESVICSASTVCKEALACGCNVYAGYYVDNQKQGYESMRRDGWIQPLGDLRLYKGELRKTKDSSIHDLPFDASIITRLVAIFKTL